MKIAIRVGFCVLVAGAATPAQDDGNPFRPFDAAAFEAHAEKLGASPQRLAAFRAQAAQESMARAADELLRDLLPEYDAAVRAAEDGRPRAAIDLTRILAATEDPWLRAHCRYHLGRVFLDGDDPESAREVFGLFLRHDRNRSPLDAQALFFYARALAEIPDPDAAVEAFGAFLRYFPEAPQRFLTTALQQRAELEARRNNPLHGIADAMKHVERRIRRTDTGKETQQRQQEIIARLQRIIEMVEEQEKQSGGAPGGLGNPQNPASKSAAPAGKTRIGSLRRVSTVAEQWGKMKDRDREAIETEVQTKVPGHYRKMLQEYFKRLGAGGR